MKYLRLVISLSALGLAFPAAHADEFCGRVALNPAEVLAGGREGHGQDPLAETYRRNLCRWIDANAYSLCAGARAWGISAFRIPEAELDLPSDSYGPVDCELRFAPDERGVLFVCEGFSTQTVLSKSI